MPTGATSAVQASTWREQSEVECWLTKSAAEASCDVVDAALAVKLGACRVPRSHSPYMCTGVEKWSCFDLGHWTDGEDTVGRRNQFHYPVIDPDVADSPPCVYLCGNSLGLQPVNVSKYVNEELQRWSRGGVRGHFEGAGR